eukprot:gene8196-774_t
MIYAMGRFLHILRTLQGLIVAEWDDGSVSTFTEQHVVRPDDAIRAATVHQQVSSRRTSADSARVQPCS